ncbi:M23 family metallopeptidase [Malaciobacter sp. WC5094]
MEIKSKNNLNKNIIIIFLIFLVVSFSYIFYLNLNILDLKKDIEIKNNVYKIQINNRINEIEQLNTQLSDLQKLLDIGLDLSLSPKIYMNEELTNKDKKYILSSIPSSSPLKKVFITSEYGYRIHPILKTNKLHSGVDLRAKIGTNIHSTANGIVLLVRNYDPGGYGKMIKIIHNYGFQTLYAHLDDVFVEEGDIIKKGDIIGLSGNTGRSNGPHLHYEIRFLDKHINPRDFLYWNIKTFEKILNRNINLIDWEKLIKSIKDNNLIKSEGKNIVR